MVSNVRPAVSEGHERVLVLVKALPHVGRHQSETVCCAGVTAQGKWRRLYPIHFRRLTEKFKRWEWVEYDWRAPTDDVRPESRRVQQDTINVCGEMRERERAPFLNKLVLPSTHAAASRNETLTLIRPKSVRFHWKRKTAKEIEVEKQAYFSASRQGSFFDAELKALEPCPFAFKFDYRTTDGKPHTATCDDWETAATYYRFKGLRGEDRALQDMSQIFGERYPRDGMVFAMGTHSKRPDQWLLVGVIRLDEVAQLGLAV